MLVKETPKCQLANSNIHRLLLIVPNCQSLVCTVQQSVQHRRVRWLALIFHACENMKCATHTHKITEKNVFLKLSINSKVNKGHRLLTHETRIIS